MLVLALIAAATLAGGPNAPSKASKKAPEMVQLTKTVCKGSRATSDYQTPVCRGTNSRIVSATDCFCSAGYQKYEAPACWPDGAPAMKPKGRRPDAREYERMMACEQIVDH